MDSIETHSNFYIITLYEYLVLQIMLGLSSKAASNDADTDDA